MEQGQTPENISPLFDIQQNEKLQQLSLKVEKDPLKFTPSKRLFIQTSVLKTEKKNGCSLKSNSKVLKKKRHKDKFKMLLKLDKLDPLQSHLAKWEKCGKKKDKLLANSQIRGKIPARKENSWVGKSNQVWQFPPFKQLEYTFDILSSTVTNPQNPGITEKESEGHKVLDFLTGSSCSPTVKSAVTSKLVMGDLIDLGTPNKSDSKDHCRTSVRKTSLSIFSPFPKNSEKPSPINRASKSNGISDELLSLEHLELKDHPVNNEQTILDLNGPAQYNSTLVGDHQCQGRYLDTPQPSYNSNYTEDRVSSPIHFYGFPCLQLATGECEKQQIMTELKSGHSQKMLIDQLNENPFPKIVRENGKVHIRRRAISMDDTLIAFRPSKYSENMGGHCEQLPSNSNPSEVENAVEISNVKCPCPQTLELRSGQKSTELIEELELSDLTNSPNSVETRSSFDGTGLDNNCESLGSCKLKSITHCGTDGGKGLNSSPNTSATDDHLTSEDHSNSILPQPCDVIREEDSNISTLNVSANLPPIAKESEKAVEEITSPEPEVDELETISEWTDVRSTEQVVDHPHAANNESVGDEHVNNQDKTQRTKAEQNDQEKSMLELQVSSNLAVPSNQNVPSKISTISIKDSLNANSPPGVRLDDPNDLVPLKTLDQAPFQAVTEKESAIFSASNTLDRHSTNAKGNHQWDGNEKIRLLNEDASLKSLESILNQPESRESLRLSETVLCKLEKSVDTNSKVDGATETKNCSSGLMEISLWELHDNTESNEIDNPAIQTSPTKEIATPTNITFGCPNVDSSFSDENCITPLNHWVLPAGKKFRRSLSIIRNLEETPTRPTRRGRHYEKSVEEIIRLQGDNAEARTPVQSLCKRLSRKRLSWMRQITPPRMSRSTFTWSPTIRDRGTLYETPPSRKSIYSTPMQQNLINRMSIRSPMLGTGPIHSPAERDCPSSSQYTCRDAILTICKQSEPCCFSDIISEENYKEGYKIGEGVFGEVFSITRDNENTVLKIIPVEGQQLVNGEKQKTYQEVLSELVIAKELNELRYQGEVNMTSGFAEIIATSLVQDCYPEHLLQFWEEFDQTKGSDNENPKMFDKEQLFIVMEQSNGGKDMESYVFSSAKQSLSVFKQIAFTLAVGEKSMEFEHRDLHWGNVLVSKTSKKQIIFTLNGSRHSVASNGVKCTIIDYTLSRIKYNNQVPIFNDIGKDPEMFIATGDYQFDIYRSMKNDVEDDWCRFTPKTNARWLHYLLDKMLSKVKYQRKTAKIHKDSLKALSEIYEWVEDCGSAFDVALRLDGV